MASSRSRISTSLATVIALAGAGGLCWLGARSAAGFIEQRSREDVQLALSTAGQDWVDVTTDGLQVRLSGTAPSEVDRFRAMTQAATAVDSSRIIDEMTVASIQAMTPPDFKVELLRNDDGISLIGLVPASTDRVALVRNLKSETAAPKVTDLLETADYPVPDNWDAVIRYGLRVTQLTPRAKISISPGAIQVTALADSRAEKGRLEGELKRGLPKGVTLTSDISAPRPVIAPFTLRFLIDENGPHFDACAADNEAGRDRILDAALRAGVTGTPGCTLALGSPTPDWADAAVPAIQAVAALGKGSVTISDADIALIAPADVDPARFNEVTGNLEQVLPPVFSLQAQLEQAPDMQAGPAEFTANMASDRTLTMRGRITDQRMREAVDSFARARFASVQGNLRNDDTTPGGWTVKVIAALEATDALHSGQVKVTPDLVELTGTSGDPRAAERAAASLSQRLGAGAHYRLSIRYDRRLDPALGLPTGAECMDRLNIIMSESEIGFEPNKSTIAGDPEPTLARLAEAMTDCTEFQIEAGGHTDSQGSEGFNADLSRSRAQALVTKMGEADINIANITSRGYGESQPIASNETEVGREANRRIEFRLLSDMPVRTTPLSAPVTVEGVTAAAAVTPATAPAEAAAQPAGTDAPETGAAEVVDTPVAAAAMQGPQLPQAPEAAGVAPATIGVSERFQTLDEREENIRVPVQTPDENTPRPAPRPDTADAAPQTQESQTAVP